MLTISYVLFYLEQIEMFFTYLDPMVNEEIVRKIFTVIGVIYLSIMLNYDELREVSRFATLSLSFLLAGIVYVAIYSIYEINSDFTYDKYIIVFEN